MYTIFFSQNIIPIGFSLPAGGVTALAVAAVVLLCLIVNGIVKKFKRNRECKHQQELDIHENILHELSDLPDRFQVFTDMRAIDRRQHVVISNKGVFLIQETFAKDAVYGSKDSTYWEVLSDLCVEAVDNPVLTVKMKMLELASLQQCMTKKIKPVIVYPDQATLNVHADIPVLTVSEFGDYIRASRLTVFSKTQVDEFTERYITHAYKGRIKFYSEVIN